VRLEFRRGLVSGDGGETVPGHFYRIRLNLWRAGDDTIEYRKVGVAAVRIVNAGASPYMWL
jgi:hypothetical protein